MLKHWQIKFPNLFLQFPNIDDELNIKEQIHLSTLLQLIDDTDSKLLDEETLHGILEKLVYLNELDYLLTLAKENDCLNKRLLHALFINQHLPYLKENIALLAHQTPLSTDVITFLYSTPIPGICVEFILKTTSYGMSTNEALNYLSEHLVLNGLGRAMSLFELGQFCYRKQNLEILIRLSKVLANPLSQTIFDARLRGFSDYTMISEPLNTTQAQEVIHQLLELTDEASQIQVFFDYFIQFRPYPPSQKYIVYFDIADKVASELQSSDIHPSLQDIQGIFNQIKYRVASEIESEDLYSTRTYQDLMTQIESSLQELLDGHESQENQSLKFGK